MLTLKYLLEVVGYGLLAVDAAIVIRDWPRGAPLRWHEAARLAALALFPLLSGIGIVVVPAGWRACE